MLNTALRFMSECDRAGLKYRESRDMDDGNSVVVCAVNGKNNARYDVVLIFSQDERNVSLRVFNILNFPEEKALDIMKLCNELNGRYRWVKLFTRQDHLELQVDAVISEAGRPTESWTDMGDGDGGELNRKMEELRRSLPEHRSVTIAYFQPDAHKAGGAYLTVTGEVRLINEHERLIELKDGRTIPIDRIKDMSMT